MAREGEVVLPRRRHRLATSGKALPALLISNLLLVFAASGGSFNSVGPMPDNPADALAAVMRDQTLREAGSEEVSAPGAPLCDLVDTYGRGLIPCLFDYVLDESPRVRRTTYDLLAETALKYGTPEHRRQVLSTLLDAELHDPDTGVRRHRLLAFSAADFTEDARRLLAEELADYARMKNTHDMRNSVILLAGVADAQSSLAALREIELLQKKNTEEAGLSSENRLLHWTGLRARARLGDREAIQECIDLVEAEPDRDERAMMLKALSYVRQSEVVEYTSQRYLFSDEIDEGNGVDIPPLPHYERAADALRDMLVGFPELASIEEQRAWMSQQATWDILR